MKIITFDFWNTLAIPNKTYATKRDGMLSNYGISKETYTKVKSVLDQSIFLTNKRVTHHDGLIEFNRTVVTPEFSVKMLLGSVSLSSDISILTKTEQIIQNINDLFLEYPPTIKDDKLDETFRILKEHDIIVGIISNTNFVSGTLLNKVLPPEYHFDFKIFSDMVGVSKPNIEIFNMPFKFLNVSDKNLSLHHIGDDKTMDYAGARNSGNYGYLINSKEDILKTVKQIISS